MRMQLMRLEESIKDRDCDIARYKDKNRQLEAVITEREEEIIKLKAKVKTLQVSIDDLDKEMLALKDTHRTELDEYGKKIYTECETRSIQLEETCKKLKEENASLKLMQSTKKKTKRLIPFLEEPYDDSFPVRSEETKERVFELEAENRQLKVWSLLICVDGSDKHEDRDGEDKGCGKERLNITPGKKRC
eukprot:TRINITY_DN13892_c0_g1_i1.p1 TRINITY_DN13892_c0_g1~~TRINITY_DN13892_c0_g1_i1.p1  ORF type:complete len:190 (+),score=31.08 TRINITY_DN13892_c0_g1_i1:251-820(+)